MQTDRKRRKPGRRTQRQSSWHRFRCADRDCALQIQERLSTSDGGNTVFFHVGMKSINLHDRNMNAKLSELRPLGFLTPRVIDNPKLWEPFVRYAVQLRLLD